MEGESAGSRSSYADSIDVVVHKGRPIDFSRGLTGAYMGAASNGNVRKLLLKTTQAWAVKGSEASRPLTAGA